MMHFVNWMNGILNVQLDDLARITIFLFFQIGLMLSFWPVEFHYPPGHWMRGFACVPLISLLAAVLEFAMRDEERLGNSIQIMLIIALMAWATIDSSLEDSTQFKHLLGVTLAMEVAILSRLLQPSHDDVKGQMGRWGTHWYAFSEELPWILLPVVCFFWALYEFNAPLFDLLCLMSLFSLLYKQVWRGWRRMVKFLEENEEVTTN